MRSLIRYGCAKVAIKKDNFHKKTLSNLLGKKIRLDDLPALFHVNSLLVKLLGNV